MILRTNHGGLVLLCIACLTWIAHTEVIETSVLSSPETETTLGLKGLKEEHLTQAVQTLGNFAKRILGSSRRKTPSSRSSGFQSRQDSSITSGDVVSGAANLESRIDTTLNRVRTIITSAIASVEDDIATSNRDKVILALANFLGMVFGIFKATSGALDWNAVSPGNKIQVFAQILYGYGYWGPFALEYEKSTVDCGIFDLERALAEYSYVTSYQSGNLNPTIGTYFTTELNGKIKENLYCLISRSSGNQVANELDTYVNVYTQLLSENIAAQA
jgi:hypothetical protein